MKSTLLPQSENQIGELFAWGRYTGGVIKQLSNFKNYKISGLRGDHRTACILSEGKLLRLNGTDADSFELSEILDIAVGQRHALALDSHGFVWAHGTGESGQLGLGATCRAKSALNEWVKVIPLGGRKVISIACGSRHSAAVTAVGDVYTWGRGFEGQTGHAPVNKCTNLAVVDNVETHGRGVHLLPKLVASLASQQSIRDPAKLVACGENFTIIVTAAGAPWAWGEGRCGELGIGKCTAAQRTPRRVCWPDDASSCCSVACGWAHVLAIDADGTLWGFNRFGQLGFGARSGLRSSYECHVDQGSHKKCANMQLKPLRVALFPGRVKLVETAANSSAALRAEDGMLFSWGSGEAGRLGHGQSEDEEQLNPIGNIASVDSPRAVQGMHGRIISSMALTEVGGFAFVPSSVSLVEPPLLPISGGAKLILRGGGFWDSSDCVVKFIPVAELDCVDTQALPRSSVGRFVAPESACLKNAGRSGVLCKLPQFAVPCDAFVEVAMNGKDFTCNRVRLRLYRDPVLEKIAPTCCSCASTITLAVLGSHLFESGLIKVRFKERGNSGREWMAPASFSPTVCGVDNSCVPDGDGQIICASPLINEGEFPVEARVSVALNGVDFIPLHKTIFVIHDATLTGLVPDCRQILPDPQDATFNESQRTVRIQGRSFFNSRDMSVRLKIEHGAVNILYICDTNYLDRQAVTFTVPTLSELLASIKESKSPRSGDGDTIDEDADTGLLLPDQKSWFCGVQLSLNGCDFLDSTLPFLLYSALPVEEIQTLGPKSGPSSGGSRLLFRLPSRFVHRDRALCPNYKSAIVKLQPAKGNLADRKILIIPDIDRKLLPGKENEYVLAISLLTPPFNVEPNQVSMNVCTGTSTPEDLREIHRTDTVSSPEDDGMEDQNVDPQARGEIQGAFIMRRVEMSLYLALDGEHYNLLCNTHFTYYATPLVQYLKTTAECSEEVPVVRPGIEISIYGTDFFDTDSIRVQLAYSSSETGKTEFLYTDGEFSKGAIKFTTPELPTNLHDPETGFDGCMDSNDELKVVVEVSFNNNDFSHDARWFYYQCT